MSDFPKYLTDSGVQAAMRTAIRAFEKESKPPRMRKEKFTVAGETFDTAKVRDGMYRFLYDRHIRRKEKASEARPPQAVFQLKQWSSDDEKYLQMHIRLEDLCQRSGMPVARWPRLAFSNYGIPAASVSTQIDTGEKRIVVDHALVQLLTSDEMEGILAHELAHIIMDHEPPIRPKSELAADRLAGELSNPNNLRHALEKHMQFKQALRDALPRTDMVAFQFINLLKEVVPVIAGYESPRHPPMYIRTDRLRQQAKDQDRSR